MVSKPTSRPTPVTEPALPRRSAARRAGSFKTKQVQSKKHVNVLHILC